MRLWCVKYAASQRRGRARGVLRARHRPLDLSRARLAPCAACPSLAAPRPSSRRWTSPSPGALTLGPLPGAWGVPSAARRQQRGGLRLGGPLGALCPRARAHTMDSSRDLLSRRTPEVDPKPRSGEAQSTVLPNGLRVVTADRGETVRYSGFIALSSSTCLPIGPAWACPEAGQAASRTRVARPLLTPLCAPSALRSPRPAGHQVRRLCRRRLAVRDRCAPQLRCS